ncbi:helix-turn-helix domain-containing protein [Clostridium butyricum]|uniref:helix-turn-helix domain-containing protein n=1 Tax=Clostridium butyricum TaxID=1492 RepID=UPI0022E3DFAA|nr:helix-turn-helix transcriptional regulator [Clostridium butyricum]
MEVKDIIKKRREELGLTYEQLGNMVGVGKSTVRKWETGLISNMRRDNIVALSKALNLSPALIMGWSDESENNKRELEYLKVENDLKNIILNKYNSIEDFSTKNNLSYTKVDKIFKKGIGGTDLQLIFKICSILNIDVDSVADGEIHFNNPLLKYTKFPSTLTDEQSILLVNFDNLDTEDKNKVIDYTQLLSNQEKYKDTANEISATKDNVVELNAKEDEEEFIPYKSFDELGAECNAAHADDLTPEKLEHAKQVILKAENEFKLAEWNRKHNK